jgi:histidinol-phosphate phosphatase family protein
MRQAVILAGGKGTRLAERLGGRPKPLVAVDGVPLLQRQIETLSRNGVTDVLLLVSHAADQIAAFCHDLMPWNLRITLIDDGSARGTAGALTHAFAYLAERFLVVYGDTLFDVDIGHFWKSHEASMADASLLIHPNDHPFDSDLVEVDDDRRVVAMHAAPHNPHAWLPNLVNAAMYVIERRAIAFWGDTAPPTDIARDLFPAMLRRGDKLHGYVSFEYIKDIGTPKRLDKAIEHLRAGVIARARRDVRQKAVFLDRDGTMNQPCGHLARAEDIALIPGTGRAVKRLNESEYRVVVVTNQPVLARGETTTVELRRIHAKMEALLGRDGGFIDRLYYCPHHPDAGYPGEVVTLKRPCLCRKPSPGMVDQASEELNIDFAQSWLIGDSVSDILLARVRGIASILVHTGMAGRDGPGIATPDFVAADLAEGVSLILDRWPVLSALATPLAAYCAPGSVVVMGGLARTGKSSFASALALTLRRYGRGAYIVPLDNWRRGAADQARGLLGRYDMAAAERAVASLSNGSGAILPEYAPRACLSRPGHNRLEAEPGDVIIVEGYPALLSDPLRSMAALTVSVDCLESVRRARFEALNYPGGVSAEEGDTLRVALDNDEDALIRAAGLTACHRVEIPNVISP